MAASAQESGNPEWPVKSCELQNNHLDTTRWINFPFRPDDIVIASWGKSGTTWTQQIVSQLIFNGAEDTRINEESLWLDLRVMPAEALFPALEAQTHRRFIKTHAPIETVEFSPKAKYIFVARDGRDALWSLHNHNYNATPVFYGIMNDTPGRVGPALQRPPADPRQYFLDFVDNDENDSIAIPFWRTIRGWYAARNLPNLLLVHFNDLKADLEGEIRCIAEFLDVPVPEDKRADILEHCSFAYMKEHAAKMAPPQAAAVWEGGADTFIHKGSNGRWRDVLSVEDVRMYEEKAVEELGEECAGWLAEGRKAWER
jgi:aryl sulfotransferase